MNYVSLLHKINFIHRTLKMLSNKENKYHETSYNKKFQAK